MKIYSSKLFSLFIKRYSYFKHRNLIAGIIYKYNYQFQVKLQIIQAISVQSLKKQFYVQNFLSQFNVSHAKQTQIKNVIIQTLDELKKNQAIQAQIELNKTDNSLIKTNIITARLLIKTKIIYFYEIMQYQNLVL